MNGNIRGRIEESIQVKQNLLNKCLPQIEKAAGILVKAYLQGKKAVWFGNGGSAADCQHMAAEFTSRLTKEFVRPALPAIALTTDSSFLTAFTNDIGFDDVFLRLVEALGKLGDVLLGISTSGNSINVIRAIEAAKARHMLTIGLTGQSGKIREIADICIVVPSDSTQYIQETHLAVEHIICDIVEQTLYGN